MSGEIASLAAEAAPCAPTAEFGRAVLARIRDEATDIWRHEN
ncbi:MAG TPA: hypothetical protein VFQ44_12165 [Streptosporangiaceae bacterium]|nr:hypothetical protein [Streptosporangiaceae bacterium]